MLSGCPFQEQEDLPQSRLGWGSNPSRNPLPPPVTALALGLQDFGDYQDGYYSVQTTEGEQIAQLIAGYIDIILKKVGLGRRLAPDLGQGVP